MFLNLLFILLNVSFASDFSVRAASGVIWGETPKGYIVSQLGEEGFQELEADLLEGFDAFIQTRYPEEWKKGQSLSSSGKMERNYHDLLHMLLTVSRFQVLRSNFGEDKTSFSLAMTLNVAMANLSTGEVLGSETFTTISQLERVGNQESISTDDLELLSSQVLKAVDSTTYKRFADKYQIGVIEAKVIDKESGNLVLHHGSVHGAYKGEVFKDEKGESVRIIHVQQKMSIAQTSGKAGVGDVLKHVGLPKTSTLTPTFMVLSEDMDNFVAPGVLGAELNQWMRDGLSSSDFTVVPPSDALFLIQSLEAGDVNISRDALVGNMSPADVVVVPSVVSYSAMNSFDEETQSSNYILKVIVSCSFLDAQTGAVIYSTYNTFEKKEQMQSWGRQVDVHESFPGLLKDGALQLVQENIVPEFVPNYVYGTVKSNKSGVLTLNFDTDPFSQGANVELLSRAREITHPDTKEKLGFVEEVVGSAKIVASDGSKQTALLNMKSANLAKGLHVKGVRGIGKESPLLIQLGTVTVHPREYQQQMGSIVEDALYSSGQFTVVPKSDSSIMSIVEQELNSGSYAQSYDPDGLLAGTHLLNLDITLDSGQLVKKRKTVSRVYKVSVVSSIVDVENGEEIQLLSPSKGQITKYDMWKEYELKVPSKGIAVGLTDKDSAGNFEAFTYDTVLEDIRRMQLLSEKARNQE